MSETGLDAGRLKKSIENGKKGFKGGLTEKPITNFDPATPQAVEKAIARLAKDVDGKALKQVSQRLGAIREKRLVEKTVDEALAKAK